MTVSFPDADPRLTSQQAGSVFAAMRAESIFVTTTAVNTPSRPWLTANYERMVRAGGYRGIDFPKCLAPDIGLTRCDFSYVNSQLCPGGGRDRARHRRRVWLALRFPPRPNSQLTVRT